MELPISHVVQLARRLARAPGYSIATILVLGCGIGVGVAALAIAQQALVAPLPYDRSDRLVVLTEATLQGDQRLASNPTVQDWAERATRFEAMSYVTGSSLLLRHPSGPEQMVVAYPTGPFFELMRARPLLGRVFASREPSNESVVVLAFASWKNQFGGRSDIVGQRIPLGDGGATVIGVMPPGFGFPEWAQAWMPASVAPSGVQRTLQLRSNHADSRVIGRLADSASINQAQSQMNAVAAQLALAYPDDSRDWPRVTLMPMSEYTRSFTLGGGGLDLTPRIALFAGAAALILALGCANVAVLGLVRNVNRSRELAVRAALGATRGRVFRYVLAESLTLASVGGLIGLLAGWGIVRAVQLGEPELFPRLAEVQFDPGFASLALLLSILTGLLAGAVPAIRATPGATIPLMGGTRGQLDEGRSSRRLQRALIGAQVAVAVILLISSGLLLRSLRAVIDTPLGFETRGLSVVRINPPGKYDSPERVRLLYEALMRRVAQVTGVRSVAFTNHAPLKRNIHAHARGRCGTPDVGPIPDHSPASRRFRRLHFAWPMNSCCAAASLPMQTWARQTGPSWSTIVWPSECGRGRIPSGKRSPFSRARAGCRILANRCRVRSSAWWGMCATLARNPIRPKRSTFRTAATCGTGEVWWCVPMQTRWGWPLPCGKRCFPSNPTCQWPGRRPMPRLRSDCAPFGRRGCC
ncbi:MAG: ABC transporter permease [Gemmatimonadaceae bacterium]